MGSESKTIALKSLGVRIKTLRIARNLTQFDLASKVNKDYQSIQGLERGSYNPSYYYLLEIAEGLYITLVELLDF